MANKFTAAIEQAKKEEDINEAVASDFTPLPEGPVRLRFVGYIELGKHESEYQGQKKIKEKAKFIFEVTGPKIEPREDGQPHLVFFELMKSQSERAGYYKLFRKMNYANNHKVFAEMLGEAFRGVLRHNVTGEGDKKRTYVNLTDVDGGFTIAPPYYDDPESGERKMLAVPEAQTPLMCFIWNFPDQEQWNSIFIDGEWEAKEGKEAKSKNVHQNRIQSALNWMGSPMQEILFGAFDPDAAPKSDDGGSAAAGDDPLDDIPF